MNDFPAKLRIIHPLKIYFIGLSTYLFLWIVAPIDFNFQGDDQSIIIFLLYNALFILGLIVGYRKKSESFCYISIDKNNMHSLVKTISALGIFGLLVRCFERVFIRSGGAISTDFMANREAISSGGGSGSVALIGALLSSFLFFLPFFIFLSRSAGLRHRIHFPLIFISLLYPLFDVAFQGSRSSLVMYLSIFTISIITTGTLNINLKKIIVGVVLSVALVWFGGSIFWERTIQIGLDPVQSMKTSGYAMFAPASDSVVNYLTNKDTDILSGLLFSAVNFCQYILHGSYEFFYLAARTDTMTTFGLQTLYIPAKIISTIFGGADIESMNMQSVLRSGVYTTFFGPILYDFGPSGGALASLFFGGLTGLLHRLVHRNKIMWIPLYLIFSAFLPFVFVVNLFTTGGGQYAIISALPLAFLIKTKRINKKAIIAQH
ncbi:hypothetical protein ACN1C3_11965 [Pseudomonas sp. H11T01]|uniref:hypothetical protein n=1 Tax=Pseudomonas sp. H11T01 TaxID=3402749 RepID=UPI003AC3FEB5